MLAVEGVRPTAARVGPTGLGSAHRDVTVYYGLSGEGLGHARRALPVLEYLLARARVVVLASGQATDIVRARFGPERIEVRSVAGYRFEYNALERLSISGTLLAARKTAALVNDAVRGLATELRSRPSVVISDFEPTTIRAAELAGVPSLSIDHQRFLQACRFESVSPRVRLGVEFLRRIIDGVYGVPQRLVVSGFFLPPLKDEFRHARLAGVTIRDNLLRIERADEPYLVAYVRRNCPHTVERTLERSPMPVFLYGMGKRPRRGNIHYCEASDSEFSARLAACRAVVSTAGNQLIGEAFYLGKPVLAFPEPGNPEQHVNAALLNLSGGGRACSHRGLSSHALDAFIEQRPDYAAALRTLGVAGNRTILSAVDEFLDAATGVQLAPSSDTRLAFSTTAEPCLARVNAVGAGAA